MVDLKEVEKVWKNSTCLHKQEEIEAAINNVAKEMNKELAGKTPLFLCVMNGAVIFMGQLITKLTFPLQIDYIHATRFRGKMSGGDLLWVTKPTSDLKDRTIVIIEDILDAGLTLASIIDYCNQQGAKEVYTAVLVDKQTPREKGGVEKTDFTGMYVEDKFLIGYGLDYEGFFRNLPAIYAVEKAE